MKFRYILQIQLTTHTINSLEGLICPLYYRVTLGTGLQQVKKLATPMSTVRSDCDMLMKAIIRGGRGVNMTFFLREYNMFRRGSTPVSTVLRKSVRFFTINIFNNKIIIIELSKLKSGKWSGKIFSLDRNPGKGTLGT